MNLARTFRSPIAWMLLCFILFNGLACSIGHGQMLAAFSSAPPVMACGDHQDASAPMDMSTMGDHALLMKLAMSDCAFAATLALPSIFLILLGWLLRTSRPRLHDAYTFWQRTPRRTLPGLIPQAP
ncbi:DUF2946 family protein [Pseudomonas helleri]|jgi:hypothetical protein|uniref:DUF2946 family protein n=1 Tax=Pseudomonas helleri TaxID=1608996 RepID=UPI003F961EE5